MKKIRSILLLFFAFVICMSCSKDDASDVALIGSWELTSWTIDIPMDLNSDTIFNTNLLEESDCANNELLVFESNGTFYTNMTYNPMVNISLLNGTMDEYVFDVECDLEGTIGLSGSYIQNGNAVAISDNTAIINGNTLSLVFEDAINIYNEDFTEIVASEDLTLIYTKK